MKKIYNIILLISLSLLFSCSEDIGNYDYQDEVDMGTVIIQGFNTNNTVEMGETIDLIASVYLPGHRDENEFKSSWIAYNKGDKDLVDTLGSGSHISYVVNLPVGDYVLLYTVNDTVYDVTYTSWTSLRVSGAPDGWMFLEKDENGVADISMYGYNSKRNRIFISKILSNPEFGVGDEMRKNIRGIHSTSGASMKEGNYGLWVEGEHTFLLEPDNAFRFESTYLSKFSVEGSETFEGKKIIRPSGIFSKFIVFGEGKIYQSMQNTALFLSSISTYYDGEDLTLAPLLASSNGTSDHIVFDTGKKRFMLLKSDGLELLVPSSLPSSSEDAFPEGDDAIYLSSELVDYKVLMKSVTGIHAPKNSFYEYSFRHQGATTNVGKVISGEKLYNLDNSSYFEYTTLKQLYYSHDETLYTTKVEGGQFEQVEVEFQGGSQLEGKITCLYSHKFKWLYGMGHFPEFTENAKYLVIATENPDGTGTVYFTEPKQGDPSIMTIKKQISTDNPVYSITFSERK